MGFARLSSAWSLRTAKILRGESRLQQDISNYYCHITGPHHDCTTSLGKKGDMPISIHLHIPYTCYKPDVIQTIYVNYIVTPNDYCNTYTTTFGDNDPHLTWITCSTCELEDLECSHLYNSLFTYS